MEWYFENLALEVKDLKRMLAPLKEGKLQIGTKVPGESWVDVTPARIADIERTIAIYEKLIADRKNAQGS